MNALQLLSDVLSDTSWSPGSIDGVFNVRYRSFEHSGSVADAIGGIAETFGALPIYDTLHKQVHLYDPETYGQNKGLYVSRDKLLKNVVHESSAQEQYTRLRVRGKDGLGISGVSSTGSPYLENYAYGYAAMSDNLVQALQAYEAFKQAKENEFAELLEELGEQRAALTVARGEWSDLKSELDLILDTLDGHNSRNEETQAEQARQQKQAKEQALATKSDALAQMEAAIAAVQGEIADLHELLAIENHLSANELLELDEFIYETEYANDYISDPVELREAAQAFFETLLVPKLVVSIELVNLLELVEMQEHPDVHKIVLGDRITIAYEESGIEVTARMVEIRTDYEQGTISLTISNIEQAPTDGEQWLKQLNTSIGSARTFAMRKYAYDNTVERTDEVSQLLANTWSAIDREIEGGLNNSISISRRGIITTDTEDPKRMTIVQNSVIGLSKNGGENWQTALTPDGVVGQSIYGQIIAGNDLTITNQGSTFRVSENGVEIAGAALTIGGGLPESELNVGVAGKLNNAVQKGQLYNGVQIDTANGLVITRNDNRFRAILNATEGLRLQARSGSVWLDRISADENGNLKMTGEINATSGSFSGNITASGTITGGTFNGVEFKNGSIVGSSINVGNGAFTVSTGGNVVIKNGSIRWSTIDDAPVSQWQNPSYIKSTYIDSTTIQAPSISGGYITGGTIVGGSLVGNHIKTTGQSSRVELSQQGFESYYYSIKRISIEGDQDVLGSYQTLCFYGQDESLTGTVNAGGNQLNRSFNLSSTDKISISGLGIYLYASMVNFNSVDSISGLKISHIGALQEKLTNIENDINDLQESLIDLESTVSSKASINHYHEVTTKDHNHGNSNNATSGGRTYETTTPME
ncbi:phage tail protein [Paenibacillus sabuli]|uniref:phage tail protein n=1 Tax=Paenibacillus sabuli TaxID=2772509 RepID=UPI001CC2B033|nr:phage tail protein [Paenibacillus sabuli]